LDLPSKTKKINQLSGGQQRRVSLACALLQQPELLILDEPTVGVDPLLREKIWSHLMFISKTNGTTIVITTHYIEEARKANRVGLMRSGRMLAEDEPIALLAKYNQSSLENVFLNLCVEDQNRVLSKLKRNSSAHEDLQHQQLEATTMTNTGAHSLAVNDQNGTGVVDRENYSASVSLDPEMIAEAALNDRTARSEGGDTDILPNGKISAEQIKPTQLVKRPILTAKRAAVDCCICPHAHKIWALMVKDLTVIKRSIGFLIFQFLIPVIQISLFCLCIGRDPQRIPVALVNDESFANYPTGNRSLLLLTKINTDYIQLHSFDDMLLATAYVEKGDYYGVMNIRKNFSQAILDKLTKFKADPATLDQSAVHLFLDMTNQQVTYVMQNSILTATQLFMKELLIQNKIDPRIADPPVIIEKPIYGDLTPRFLNFAAPGMMISIIFFLAIGLTALIFVVEKKEGLLERSWIAGIIYFLCKISTMQKWRRFYLIFFDRVRYLVLNFLSEKN
ncbi:unnamed protein product, partial [Didymodactylos carnosus]